MSTTFTLDGLEERIKVHENAFGSLLKLIPAQYYITKDLSEEEQNSKYQHNKKRSAPKQEIKERTKKAKKAKLDPENNRSILDIQSEMLSNGGNDDDDEEEEDEEEEDDDHQGRVKDVTMAEPDSDADIIEDDSEAPVIAKSTTHNFEGLLAQVQTAAQTPAQAPKSITELRAKLEERLAKLRGKRNAGAGGETSGAAKPTSRQAILEARMKRKKDKKASQKLAKEKKAASAAGGSEGLVVKDGGSNSTANGRPSASSINDKGEVRFSKFEFEGLQKKKKGPTDIHGQLKMAEAQKEKRKVKDDIKLLKKTVKRDEAYKKKSAKEWSERKTTIKKTKDQKQKKREENIKARIDAKKHGHSKKGDKKGAKGGPKGGKGGKPKGRAGFEGKHGKKASKPSKK
ncbi:60S ribosome biogenesis protein Rrp14-domain-containing protein [Mortierella sp. GBAus27b]|nr:60S ribosome biogenesis protein Rrp14-domain-containing protein [Mortierella sp. GBAus27b]